MPQRTNSAFGDIFLVNTPNIDQLGQHLYQQELLKKQQQAKDNDLLDNEFSRNLTGIRDADIPDLTKAYGEFKQARMGTLNKRNISPDEQLDVLRKKANVYDIINQSKTNKDWETAQGKQIMTDKKGLYADDAHQQLISRMRTPVTKIDTNNDSNLLYKYSMPDLNKELKIAKGDQKEVPILLGQNQTDKFKDDKEIYKVGNNPNQFYNSLLQGVVAGNKGRNFTGIVNQKYNDQELEDLRTKYYAKINDPKFVQIYGKPEPFPESANNTDLGKAVAIETMENVVNTPLAPIKKISEVNQQRKIADSQAFQFKKQAIGNENTKAHLRLAAGLRKDAKSDGDVESADAVLHNIYDIFNQGEPKAEGMFGEHKDNLVTISDPNLLKAFSTIRKAGTTAVPPDNVVVDKSKDQINLIYNDIPTIDAAGKPTVIKGTTISMSGRDYAKQKVRETYPNKDIGQINNIVDKVISKGGGLYNTTQMYNPENQQADKPIEINSDKIDIKNLKTGKSYIIKGKNYIWNGEKFKTQ